MIEKSDRNMEIIEDKKTMSWTDLMQKYKMAYATLYRIINRHKNNPPTPLS